MLREEFTPLEVDEASLAYGAHQEVGHGGHFLGAAHTLERFRDLLLPAAAVLAPRTSSAGSATARATRRARRRDLAARRSSSYEQPPIDAGTRAELEDYVVRRRAELGTDGPPDEDHRRPRVPPAAAVRRGHLRDGGRVGRRLRLHDRRRGRPTRA